MFGSKLRSWMEAVRSKKKQHRKDKQAKGQLNNINSILSTSSLQNTANTRKLQTNLLENGHDNECGSNNLSTKQNESNRQTTGNTSRYSANYLSSPESAYSTGYSTDGTSPGTAPDCYINIHKTDSIQNGQPLHYFQRLQDSGTEIPSKSQPTSISSPTSVSGITKSSRRILEMSQESESRMIHGSSRGTTQFIVSPRPNDVLASPNITSPRQRNRIRTNPWLPGSALNSNQIGQGIPKVACISSNANSPVSCRFFNSSLRPSQVYNQSLSSSSCSSLGSSINWDLCKGSASEDECTLNEMMGKYDESYMYEKETDILSDSDPTDCDTDIDTGQDGGDEDDPLEGEFDYIDNDSFLELDSKNEKNTGHCTYFNFEVQRKILRKKTTTRRNKQSSTEKKRRSNSNKKRHKQGKMYFNGSKSAGATPVSARKNKCHPISKLALEDGLKKRSNSVSFTRDPLTTINKRDKEADRKYKELIVEAEEILKNMKINNLSPRRIPGPANKRVEILRTTECSNPEALKNRITDEMSKLPLNNFNCPKFSPKHNRVRDFTRNSPLSIRRELEHPTSSLALSKQTIAQQVIRNHSNRYSPKYRKKLSKTIVHDSSSSSDLELKGSKKNKEYRHTVKTCLDFDCPQSEPVKRKVYTGHKTVAFNLNYGQAYNDNSLPYSPRHIRRPEYKDSSENLRQQVLLNTIANLKKNLEHQSASLKQVYTSSQNIYL